MKPEIPLRAPGVRHSLLATALVAGLVASSAPAADQSWDGGAGTSSLNDAANWTNDSLPNVSGDTATWDAASGSGLALTWTSLDSGSNGINLNIASGYSGTFQLNHANPPASPGSYLSVQNITINGGTGFTLGGDGTTDHVVLRGTNVFTNNTTAPATIAEDVFFANGGGVSGRVITFAGTGDWGVFDTFALSGNGSLVIAKSGAGTLTFHNAAVYTGATNINEGTLALQGAGALSASSAINVADGAVFDVSGVTPASATVGALSGAAGSSVLLGSKTLVSTGGGTFAGDVSGTGGLTKNGGNLTLTGASTYSGPTTITAGTLTVGGTAGALNTDSAITNHGTFAITRTNAVTQGVDFSGAAIDGTGGLSVTGTGPVTLNTANGYSGGTTIGANGGASVIRATAGSALGTGNIHINGNGGSNRLELASNITLANTINLNGKNNTLGQPAAIVNVSGDNTLSNTIQVNTGGTHNTIQSDAGLLTLSGAAATGTETVPAGTALRSQATGDRHVLFTGDGDIAVSGNIINGNAGNLVIYKQGEGTLTLSGTNTNTGATTVSAGRLFVNGSLGNTAVSVADGATFGGTGTVAGPVGFAAGSLFEIDLANPLAIIGAITFDPGFGIANLRGIDWDSLQLGVSYTILETTQIFSASDIGNFGAGDAFEVGDLGRRAYFDNGSLAVVVIPEPSTVLLGGLGLFALLRRRR